MTYSSIYSMTGGTTCAGTNSSIRGFGNKVTGSYVGETVTKIEIYFNNAGTSTTAQVGVWRGGSLVGDFGTMQINNITPGYFAFTNSSGTTLQSGDIIGFQCSGTNQMTCVTHRTNGTDADSNLGAYWGNSSGWTSDGDAREYNQKVYKTNTVNQQVKLEFYPTNNVLVDQNLKIEFYPTGNVDNNQNVKIEFYPNGNLQNADGSTPSSNTWKWWIGMRGKRRYGNKGIKRISI